MICAIFRYFFLILALSVALVFLLPAFVLAVSFYILAAIFDGSGPSYYHTKR